LIILKLINNCILRSIIGSIQKNKTMTLMHIRINETLLTILNIKTLNTLVDRSNYRLMT
jgi:hypothetical protein